MITIYKPNNILQYGITYPCFYCVIIKVSEKREELPVMFKITTELQEINYYFNDAPPLYYRWLFSSLNDVISFLERKLSFQDKFAFQIEENPPLHLNCWYIRE